MGWLSFFRAAALPNKDVVNFTDVIVLGNCRTTSLKLNKKESSSLCDDDGVITYSLGLSI